MEANGSAAAVAAMIGTGALETKRKHHDEVEPFKDVKRVSGLAWASHCSRVYVWRYVGRCERDDQVSS